MTDIANRPGDHDDHGSAIAPTPAAAVPDPGLVEEPRLTDVDDRAANRVERQIGLMLVVSALCSIGFVVAYLTIPDDATLLGMGAQNLALGGFLGIALTLIGIAAIQWAKKLMTHDDLVEQRHPAASSEADRETALGSFDAGAADSGISRRPIIRRSLIAALGLLAIPPIILFRDLGPLPGSSMSHTIWTRGIRIVNDVTYTPLKLADIQLGQLVNAVPANLQDLEGAQFQDAKAKAAVIVLRMLPEDISPLPGRDSWTVDGVMCYSKICPHVGCPINLYEQQTKKLLCPCHQSTFDLAHGGRVLFGPAARDLPQLPIMVDPTGYLVAQSDFTEAVGPSFWERG